MEEHHRPINPNQGTLFEVLEIPDGETRVSMGQRLTIMEVSEFLELCAPEVRQRGAMAATLRHGEYLFIVHHSR